MSFTKTGRNMLIVGYIFLCAAIGCVAAAYGLRDWLKFPAVSQPPQNPSIKRGDTLEVVTTRFSVILSSFTTIDANPNRTATSNNWVSWECGVNLCYTDEIFGQLCEYTPIMPIIYHSCNSYNAVRVMIGVALILMVIDFALLFPLWAPSKSISWGIIILGLAVILMIISFGIFHATFYNPLTSVSYGNIAEGYACFIAGWPLAFVALIIFITCLKFKDSDMDAGVVDESAGHW